MLKPTYSDMCKCCRLGQHKEAKAQLDMALALDPQHPVAVLQQGRYEECVRGDAAAAAKARAEAAAQKRKEDRERQLAEQRAGRRDRLSPTLTISRTSVQLDRPSVWRDGRSGGV